MKEIKREKNISPSINEVAGFSGRADEHHLVSTRSKFRNSYSLLSLKISAQFEFFYRTTFQWLREKTLLSFLNVIIIIILGCLPFFFHRHTITKDIHKNKTFFARPFWIVYVILLFLAFRHLN